MEGETPETILEFLQKGSRDIRISESRNVVLVLGLTGTGKSTLTRFIAGNNSNLTSEEEGDGNYVVRDRSGKIGKSTVKSCTSVPELVIDSTNGTAYYDCPGFSDTRSLAHNIGASYFVQKIISRIDSVKILLAIDYYSVRKGGSRHGFLELLKHLYSMINDVGKFERSICLIATKVDNVYNKSGQQYTIIPDDKMIMNVVDFLQNDAKVFVNSTVDNNLSSNEQQFCARIIDILLNAKEPQHPRVGIFRRPEVLGPLSEMKILQNGRTHIRKMIFNQLVYTACSQNDFGLTISENSELALVRLKEEIKKCILGYVSFIGELLISFYGDQEKRADDLDAIHTSLKKSHDALSKIYNGNARAFVKEFVRSSNVLDVSISEENIREKLAQKVMHISNYCSYLEFIQPMLKRSTDDQLQCRDGIKNVLNYLDESTKWLCFFIDLRTTLSEYKIQQDVGRYGSAVQNLQREIDNFSPVKVLCSLKTFLAMVKEHSGRAYEIPSDTFSENRARFLKAVVETAFQEITKDKTEYKLVIKGYNVKMSEVSKLKGPDGKLFNVVEILALNKVFFDADYIKRGGMVTIIARELEVVGKRQLVLDGEDCNQKLEKAHTISRLPGSRGENGKPGLPGGSAGEFVLIGLVSTSGNMLSVSLVGGRGGRGQDGGDGVRGEDGDKVIPEERYHVYTGQTANVNLKPWSASDYPTSERVGSMGKEGGAGGNGGRGGLGGYAGKALTIFPANHGTHLPEVTSRQGSRGDGGSGGQGGQGGNQYELTEITTVKVSFFTSRKSYEYKAIGKAADGKKGDDDVNETGILPPETRMNNNLVYSLIEHKNHLRNSLGNPAVHSVLRNFLEYLEVDEGFSKFYNARALVNDLKAMERHFHDSRVENSVQSYEHLLERILKYAQNPQSHEKIDEYKMVLAYLYATTLSKICRLKENMNSELVIEIKGYLKGVKQQILQWQEFDKIVENNNIRSKYSKEIEDKIREANLLIEKKITPAIKSYNQHLIQSLDVLFSETVALKREAEAEQSELKNKKEQLAKQLVLAKILGVAQVASTVLVLLVPAGMGLGAGVGLATTVSQYLLLSGVSVDYNAASLPGAVDRSVAVIKTLFNDDMEQKLAEADKIVSDLEGNSKIKSEIQQILDHGKNDFKLHFDKAVAGDPQSLDKMLNVPKELNESLANKKAHLDKQTDVSQKIIKAISKIQDIMSISAEVYDVYKKVSKGQSSMDAISDSIKLTEYRTIELKEFTKNIYRTILPMCRLIKEISMNTNKASARTTRAALDVSKWEVQNTLTEIQTQLKEMTVGFKTQAQIKNCIDQVKVGISTMIQIYDGIQHLYDKARLADYIADITCNKAKIKVRDRGLQKDIDELELKMHKNVVLTKFHKSMNAVRQRVFPYAQKYMGNLNLPNEIEVENSSHSIGEVIRSVTGVLERLENYYTVIPSSDENESRTKFSSQEGSTKPPFYVWKYSHNEELIKDLLRGNEIMLNADISSGLKENAIKFDRIGVTFKMHCGKRQNDFTRVLTSFSVEMTHTGSSYYRWGDKVYMMKHDRLRIKHLVIRKNDDDGDSRSYLKLKNNEALLSPYTMWKLQLIGKDFSMLLDYVGEKMDVELEGWGTCIERTIDDTICTDDLKQWYVEVSHRISETDLIGMDDE